MQVASKAKTIGLTARLAGFETEKHRHGVAPSPARGSLAVADDHALGQRWGFYPGFSASGGVPQHASASSVLVRDVTVRVTTARCEYRNLCC
jgi:hypothetical protein